MTLGGTVDLPLPMLANGTYLQWNDVRARDALESMSTYRALIKYHTIILEFHLYCVACEYR